MITGLPLQYLIVVMCAIAFILFGYDQGVMSGLVNATPFLNRFNHPSALITGTMVAIFDIGALGGACGAFMYGDVLGRKRSIIFGNICIVIGGALQATAFTRAHMIVGRIVAGIGMGFITTTVPVYLVESSRVGSRARYVVYEITIVLIGIFFAQFVNYGLVFGKYKDSELTFRLPLALQCVFPFIVFTVLPFLPESPRWLALKGKTDEVHQTLARLAGNGLTADSPEIINASDLLIKSAQSELEVEKASTWKECFHNGELGTFRRLFMAVICGPFQQVTGANAIAYYGPVIFEESIGLNGENAYIMSAIASLIQAIGTLCIAPFVDKLGRRKTMLLGSTGCCICLAAIAGLSAQGGSEAYGWGATAVLFVFELIFGFTWNNIIWYYAPEICAVHMRAKGSAGMSVAYWITCFTVIFSAPSAFENIGYKFWLIWLVLIASSIPIVYFVFVETCGRTLEQIDDFFREHPGWRTDNIADNKVKPRKQQIDVLALKKKEGEHESIEKGPGSQVQETAT